MKILFISDFNGDSGRWWYSNPKIVINPSWTYEKLHCKGKSVVNEILRYKQTQDSPYILLLSCKKKVYIKYTGKRLQR